MSAIAVEALDEELRRIEAEIERMAAWDGSEAPAVKRCRWLIAEVRRGIARAQERPLSTAKTQRVTGWHRQTLHHYARLALQADGGRDAASRQAMREQLLPEAWRGLRVRREGKGYGFAISTVPPRPER